MSTVRIELELDSIVVALLQGCPRHQSVELASNKDVRDLLTALGLEDTESFITVVNNRAVRRDHKLRDGDFVSVFAPVAGG